MSDLTGETKLDRLIARLTRLINAATSALEANPERVAEWQQEIAKQLQRYHTAAYLAGADAIEVSPVAGLLLDGYIGVQLEFLERFALEIAASTEWQAGWRERAQMYARSIKAPYWSGKTKLLPLPAMPGDGTTQCLTNCGCAWHVEKLGGDNNYNAWWRLGKNDSCQTCIERSQQWAPLQIRDGVLL